MPQLLFIFYYSSVLFAAIMGILKWKQVDVAIKFIIVLMIVTSISELLCYMIYLDHEYKIRNTFYHFYNIIQAFLFSGYIIISIKPYHHRKHLFFSALFWILIGLLNAIFFEPLQSLNSNVLLVESFVFITASLYHIYTTLRMASNDDILKNSHFRLSGITLVLWSGTFFFWSTINLLFSMHWEHITKILSMQVYFNVIIYLSFGIVFYRLPKHRTTIENI